MAWKTRLINAVLLRFNPSDTVLLDWLMPRVDDSMLWEIAAADYRFEEREHLEALKGIRDRREIPAPLDWNPREVLNLTRWSEPDDPERSGSTGTRGHLIRAFCCAVLLRAADGPETQDYMDVENETLVQLIASVLRLGREASEATLRFLSWCIPRLPIRNEEYPFFALGLLLLRAALFEPGQAGADLKPLADWVVREETRARRGRPLGSESWLLGLTNSLRHEVWRRLAGEILVDPTRHYPEPAASAMRQIAHRLIPGPASRVKEAYHLPGPVNEHWRLEQSEG